MSKTVVCFVSQVCLKCPSDEQEKKREREKGKCLFWHAGVFAYGQQIGRRARQCSLSPPAGSCCRIADDIFAWIMSWTFAFSVIYLTFDVTDEDISLSIFFFSDLMF